jgi:triosephosphate isomerase
MTRTPYIAGNWKLNKTIAEAEAFIQGLLPRVATADGVDVAICPPYLALQAMVDSARGSRVAVLAQNMHEAETGAYTGEVSAEMLAEIDVNGVVLGHSERREYFGETDRALQAKVPRALEAGLQPVLCVGETEEERERGETERKLRHQVQEGLEKVPIERLGEVVVAYEPIWAIGTAGRLPASRPRGVASIRLRWSPSSLPPESRAASGSCTAVGPRPATPPSSSRWRTPDGASSARLARPGVVVRAIVAGRHERASPRESRPRRRPGRLGAREPGPGNAVSLADTPVFDDLWARYRTRS